MARQKTRYAWEARNWTTHGSIPHRLVYIEATQGSLRLHIPSTKGVVAESMMIVGAPLWYAVGLPLLFLLGLHIAGIQRASGVLLDLFLLVLWPTGAVAVAVFARRQGVHHAIRKSERVVDVTEVKDVRLGTLEQDVVVMVGGEELELTLTARWRSLKSGLLLAGHTAHEVTP
jgi:hypothetical protein